MTIDNIINKFDQFGILPHSLPNAIGLWENEQECLIWSAQQADKTQDWMEIGSFCGGSAVLLALTKEQPKLFSVDIDFMCIFDFNVYDRGQFDNIVYKIQCDSLKLDRYYKGDLSFVFLDGYHSFSHVVKEFEILQRFLTKEAIVCFHDVSPKMLQHDQEYIDQQYEWVKNNMGIFNATEQDFRIDEAVAYICKKHGYHILDIPVRKNIEHFQETGRTSWIRGQTSPFNAFTAIRKSHDS
jgi:predicted O-methyltransferase YrrM